MARQYIIGGPIPFLINETSDREFNTLGVQVGETQGITSITGTGTLAADVAAITGAGSVTDSALDLDFTTGTLDPRITFARASTATYYNLSGVITSAASGAPRFDYDPVTLAARGLLLEEQRTNNVLSSANLANGTYWQTFSNGSGSVSQTANSAVAPDGTTTAALIAIDRGSTGDYAQLYQGSINAPGGGVGSVWLKAATGGDVGKQLTFAFHTGGNYDGIAVITLTANWVRYSITGISLSSANQFILGYYASSVGTGPVSFLAWGAQAETGATATSYIPTTTAAVTRAADTAEMTGANFSSWYNASAGTFVAEYRPQSVSGTQPVISVNDTTANEAIRLYGSGADPKAIVVDGGATQADLDAGTVTVDTFHKLGLAFTLNDFAAAFDGGTVVTDVAGTLPTVTQLQFHTDIAGNVANLHIKRLQFFNTRKSDSDLQALTAQPAVGTGALIAPAAAVASTTGVSGSTITDTTLNAASAVLSSTSGVSGSTITDTTLNAAAAAVSSITGVSGSTITDTTINASPAVVSSTTGLVRAIANPSTLTAQAATLVGIGAGTAATGTGALSSPPATLASTGLALTIGSGTLVDDPATLSALAVSGSTGIGELDATAADIDSLGYVEQGGISIMIGGEWQRTTPHVRVGGAWKPATAWANVNGAWKRVA